MLYRDGKFIPKMVEPTLEQGDKRLITPCIDGPIARGSEGLPLAKLPYIMEIFEIKEVKLEIGVERSIFLIEEGSPQETTT